MNTGPTTQLEHRLTKLLADCDMDRLALLRVARAAGEFYEILEPWSRAYPTDIFIPPPPGEHGKTVDACSAAMGRHVLGKLMEDFRETLESLKDLPEGLLD